MANGEQAPVFPPYDFSKFEWRTSPTHPDRYFRQAGGGELIEDVWNRTAFGEQNLFLGVETALSAPIPANTFHRLAQAAWLDLRAEAPIIAAVVRYDEDGNTLLTYSSPKSDEEAQEWAKRSVRLITQHKTLDDARFELGKNKIPEETGDGTLIYILPHSDESYGILMHTDHTPLDGVGTKVVMTLFLKLLANHIGDPTLADKRPVWGDEVHKLAPCMTSILGPTQETQGPRYQQTLGGILNDLASSMTRIYGFKMRNVGPGPTRRLSYTFSLEDSQKYLKAVKSFGMTVNQIIHAAVCLVCTNDNPPDASTPSDAAFVFYGLVDGRHLLEEKYTDRLAFPGYCLGMSPIIIPVSSVVSASDKSEKDQILHIAEIVKKEYARQKAYPSFLAVGCQEVELILAPMKNAPPPPPWMGPWFAGDGIGETYLDPSYQDANGNTVIDVTDFFSSLNKTNPGPFFRAYSWKGKLTLSVDYNEHAMPQADVQSFLDKWIQLLRLLF